MIERFLFQKLVDHLPRKEITLITGPRQAGKTTLLDMLKKHIEQKSGTALMLNLDVEWDRVHFSSQLSLIKKIELEIGKRPGFVLIDEIQRKEDAGLFLKGLYDLNLPWKFIVTGSGSLELKENIHESLIGRKRVFELTTVSLKEFVNYKTAGRYRDRLPEFFAIEQEPAARLLEEYLRFGGYPRVVVEDSRDEKLSVINEIYQSLLHKDIAYLLHVEKTEAFSSMLKSLAAQTGKMVQYTSQTANLGVSFQTVKKYLWYAQQIFLIDLVPPYVKNIQKEIRRTDTVYFCDLGLRNFALGIFGSVAEPSSAGFLFQNLVYLMLKTALRPGAAEIRFWRTKDKAEVDFVIDAGGEGIPVEVKHKNLSQVRMSRSLHSFIEKYRPARAYVVNLSLEKTVPVKDTAVMFLPYYRLMESSLL